jgi:hypothetical protein
MIPIRAIADRLGDVEASITKLRQDPQAATSVVKNATLRSLMLRRDELKAMFAEISERNLIDVCDYRMIPETEGVYPVKRIQKKNAEETKWPIDSLPKTCLRKFAASFHEVRTANVTEISVRLLDSPVRSFLSFSYGRFFVSLEAGFRFYWRKSNKSLFWQSEVWFMTRKRQASRNKAPLAFLIVPTTLPQLFVGFIAPFCVGFSPVKTYTIRVIELEIVFYDVRAANGQHRQDFTTEETQIVGPYEGFIFHLSP